MSRFWAVVPAAGVGRRMGGVTPKQYMSLNGSPLIEHTISRLVNFPAIERVYVALSPSDDGWDDTRYAGHPGVKRVDGGEERCHSVLNALKLLSLEADESDWVLVHDAARPCLQNSDIELLIDNLQDHPVGGLLGVPVHDTVKRVDNQHQVLETVPRQDLWRAYTPQMFKLKTLLDSLESALAGDKLVTDEASAIELAGFIPMMVMGRTDNIKVTRPEDLPLAAFYLDQMNHSPEGG
ncbi:MAG: 2-C-methyl-D-erythritol 4-phosphate cytidylyltransferase [Gammaproteobacteria bacterium]|nr:2-C-methyl-D-erythritol 4-phosphate cytidylyltransferase [Gammaproteobacteria bacterium]